MKKLLARIILVLTVSFLGLIAITNTSYAEESAQTTIQEENYTFEAKIKAIKEEREVELAPGEKQHVQVMEISVLSGPRKDQNLTIENAPVVNKITYKAGDKVVINYSKAGESETYIITDFVRLNALYLLFGVFVVLTLIVARKKGFYSLVGLGVSFVIIFKFILPQLASGKNPIFIAIIASLIIIPVNFYLSHGFNKKTNYAVIGTAITLFVTSILAQYFVDLTHLTGFTTDEAGFLQVFTGGSVNIKGLLLAGIIVGGVGIFDDITISQSAIAYELKQASPSITFRELYTRTMNIGKDHIASLVNTLILVYTGAALPLLLLLTSSPESFRMELNREIIAEEIVRTLVGSIGLILAVPITTFLASYMLSKSDTLPKLSDDHKGHGHKH